MSDSTINILAEGHEDRLQRVEGTVQDLSREMGTFGVRQESMATQIAATHDAITSKLDEVATKLTTHTAAIDARLSPIEKLEADRAVRWSVAKKAILPVLGAIAGVVGTRFGESILEWLASK